VAFEWQQAAKRDFTLMTYTSVLVICPANAVTAGPEALHQLVAELNASGVSAAITYHPFDRPASVPEPYRKYRVPVRPYADVAGALIVFPEIFPTTALRVRSARAAIWWMSVNNYTCVRYGSALRDNIRYARNLLKGLRPWRGMAALKGLLHFAQSHYAETYLASHGIRAMPLSDPIPVYLDPTYLQALDRRPRAPRENVILYNPSKGIKTTARIRKTYPNWRFRPLRGFDRTTLADTFLSAKLYIDFGHHPGKDRLPREAALHGCCIITNRYGSAANPVDLPIPDSYKIDDRSPAFIADVRAAVSRVFGDFEACSRDFDGYRTIIRGEAERFRSQVRAMISPE
jgi:hypothetical protein